MYNLLSNETADTLRVFLQNTLPPLAKEWWARYVVSALTFQQQRRIEESRIESLAGLDLAALIRVLDVAHQY